MTRICIDRRDLRLLERDGIGWGHDFDCGCLRVETLPPRQPVRASLAGWLRRRGQA